MICFYGHTKEYGFLSNWYSEYTFVYNSKIHNQSKIDNFNRDGKIIFHNVEQFMMWAKAALFDDKQIEEKILNCTNPNTIKKYGRQVSNYNDSIWSNWRYYVVFFGNLLKFSQNSYLEKQLVDTQNEILVEASPKDLIWGVGLCASDPRINNPDNWRGKNLLGRALMEVRSILQARYQ